MKGLPMAWLSHLSLKDRKGFETSVRNSSHVLRRLREIIERKVEESESKRLSDYSSPVWAFEQAHRNGYALLARELDQLLEFTGK